jgi:hypothetical protein
MVPSDRAGIKRHSGAPQSGLFRHCEERSDEAIQGFTWDPGLLREACHRAAIRPTRWLAMTVVTYVG